MQILIEHNLEEAKRFFGLLAIRQIPFVTAQSLTQTAKAVQAEVIADLPKRFTIRSDWLAKGIRIKPARKGDWPHPSAQAGSRDEFLVIQEKGGTKRPRRGDNLAIPTRTLRGKKEAKIPLKSRPKPLLKTKGAYATDRAIIGPIEKAADPASADASRGRFLAYFLKQSVKIKPRFHFQETAEKTAREAYGPIFTRNLDRAIKARRS